jgi:hypothetical protein
MLSRFATRLKVEDRFAAIAASPHWRVALRDAIGRIMFESRAAGIEMRARMLFLKTQTYRELTRSSEQALRDWLCIAVIEATETLSRSAGA